MASAIALTVAVPGVRQSLLEGDLEGAADEVFDTIDGIDNFSVKAATVGAVIATDAVAHFPVVGSVVPGTLEFIGTLTAVLLLERYLLVGEDKFEDDFEALGDSLPSELPKSVDELIELFSPIGTSVKKATDAVSEINPEEVSEAAADVPEWFGDSENPLIDIGGPATAIAGTVALGNVAKWPLVAIIAPRLLELLGAGVVVYSVQRYGTPNADVKEDLGAVVDESKRALRNIFE